MRRIAWLLPVMALLLCLSGCLFGSVEEMLATPEPPAVYQSLQRRIAGEQGAAESIAPLGGENRQSVQLVDLDGDGWQEAVAFFRDETAKQPLRLVIFRQGAGEDYQVFARIESAGNDIQSVEFADLTGDACREILVTWQVSDAVRTLVAYTVTGGEPAEILRSSCDRSFTGDLTGDGKSEILLAQKGEGSRLWKVLCYTQGDGAMKKTGETFLSRGAEDILCWKGGALAGGEPAAFVTSRFQQGERITDVLCLEDGTLLNCALIASTGQSAARCPDWPLAVPMDMTGDGITDVPAAVNIQGYGESAGESFSWLNWWQYQANGTSGVVRRTCCGPLGQWYLELPADWTGDFFQCRRERKEQGEDSLSIAREKDGKAFLTIARLTDKNRGVRSNQNGWFLLYAERGALYAARLDPGVWDCGMDRNSLIKGFHISP